MRKWSTIYKQKKAIRELPISSDSDEWICTDFGHTIDSDALNMFVMQPLHTHPDGEDFGKAPHGFEVLFVTKEQLDEYFKELPGRDYYEEQRVIREKFLL